MKFQLGPILCTGRPHVEPYPAPRAAPFAEYPAPLVFALGRPLDPEVQPQDCVVQGGRPFPAPAAEITPSRGHCVTLEGSRLSHSGTWMRAKFEVDHSTIMIENAMLYLMSAAWEKQQHRFCTALPVDHFFITRSWLNLTRRWVHLAPGSAELARAAGAAAVALRSSARRHPWRLC